MPSPTPYNLAAAPQNIAINEAGVGADGPYAFIVDQSVSPAVVRVYKDPGTGIYAILQTITNPDGNDALLQQGCYDNTSGFLVIGSQNKLYLYKVVAGLFALQDTYNPGGATTLLGGTEAQISGTNVVLLGRDFGGPQNLVCHYLTVNTGVFVFQQKFDSIVFVATRGTFLRGTASFSGTHFVIGDSASHVLTCFELSGGVFSQIQTIAGALFANVLASGFLFILTTGTPVVNVLTLSGTWTVSQTINYPAFSGIVPSAPYSFVSTTLGASILLISAASSINNDILLVAAYLSGSTWIVYQTGSFDTGSTFNLDPQGLVGAQSALLMPLGGINQLSIFLSAGGTGVNIILGLNGMKVYPS